MCKSSTTCQLITKTRPVLFSSLRNRSCPILVLIIPAPFTCQFLDVSEIYNFQAVWNTSLKFLRLVTHTLQAPLKMFGRNLPLLKSVRVLLLSSIVLHLAAFYWLHSFWVHWLAGLFKRCGRKKAAWKYFFHQKDDYWHIFCSRVCKSVMTQ